MKTRNEVENAVLTLRLATIDFRYVACWEMRESRLRLWPSESMKNDQALEAIGYPRRRVIPP